ncbi:MAG TPA: response regulator [Fibrobacteria bacterium]|nr:response regulator [Fibrobacteria bacterium]
MTPLRLLLVEDNEDDAFLLARHLRQDGFQSEILRVDDPSGFREALSKGPWDLVLSDFHLPGFSGLAALEILGTTEFDIPFILVSGAIGEHTAVEAMRAGARDYILKDNLARLGPAIRRELLESAERKARRQGEEHQRALESALQAIRDVTSREWGVGFFRSLVGSLAKALDFKGALVAEFDPESNICRILANYGLDTDRMEYPLAGSFSEEILVRRNASAQGADFLHFEDCAHLARSGIRSMSGIRLDSRDGEPRGLLMVVDDKPAEESQLTHDILSIFAARAGAELDRIESDRKRREVEQKLVHAEKLEALGTFAGGIAHDINNILTSIWGHAQLLEMWFPDSPGSESVRGIMGGCRRARDLARQILLFGRRQDPVTQTVHLDELVEETFKLLRAWAPATVHMEAEVDSTAPPVLGDSGQILQVLVNLCTNSVHAMQGSGGLLKVRVERISDAWIRMEVSDTGTGIPSGNIQRIFEPFFTTKGPDKGTGLGLSVVHGIVRNHRGTIAVRSAVGQGTTFTIELPVQVPGKEDRSPEADRMPRGKGERILVVDDEPAIAEILSHLLQILGYDCKAFTRPSEALDEFRRDPGSWSAVISDFTMPGLTGKELALEIQKIEPNIPVLLTSGYETFDEGENPGPGHIAAFIPKPFQTGDIARLLHRCLAEA